MSAGGTNVRGGDDQDAYATQDVPVGIAPARRKGQRVNWSTMAKTRTYLIAAKCMQNRKLTCVTPDGETKHVTDCACSPYRIVYDDGRAKYAESVHPGACVRCGPAGKPAFAGSPLSDGHKHARAMRLVMKAILKDIWIASQDIYDTEGWLA